MIVDCFFWNCLITKCQKQHIHTPRKQFSLFCGSLTNKRSRLNNVCCSLWFKCHKVEDEVKSNFFFFCIYFSNLTVSLDFVCICGSWSQQVLQQKNHLSTFHYVASKVKSSCGHCCGEVHIHAFHMQPVFCATSLWQLHGTYFSLAQGHVLLCCQCVCVWECSISTNQHRKKLCLIP